MKKYDCILFDLDGTLVASAESVRVSLAYAMRELFLPCPDLSDYSKYVGPPLEDTFRGLCAVPEELICKGMELYRGYYDEVGQKASRLFDGVTELLSALKESGKKLAICTSKNEPVAEKVAHTMGLTPYFDAVCGSAPDGSRKAKIDLIPYALDALGCSDKEKAVMVGDTRFDAKGAQQCGVDFLGVTYGYGTRDGMAAYGAVGFADSPQELLRYLLG